MNQQFDLLKQIALLKPNLSLASLLNISPVNSLTPEQLSEALAIIMQGKSTFSACGTADNAPLTPPTSAERVDSPNSCTLSPVASPAVSSPPRSLSPPNKTVSAAPLDLSVRCNSRNEIADAQLQKMASEQADSVVAVATANLFQALELQLANANLAAAISRLSPVHSQIDSPPSSDAEITTSACVIEEEEDACEQVTASELTASLLEPEVIISTDSQDGENTKRRSDALVCSTQSGHLTVQPVPCSSVARTAVTLSTSLPAQSPAFNCSFNQLSILQSNAAALVANVNLGNRKARSNKSTRNMRMNPVLPNSAVLTASALSALQPAFSSSGISLLTQAQPIANSNNLNELTKAVPSAPAAIYASRTHMQRLQGIKNISGGIVFPCDQCDQLFPAPDRLNKHKASRHKQRTANANSISGQTNLLPEESMESSPGSPDSDGKNKNFFCNVCMRGFSRSDMLTRHFRLHSGLKPYTCEICCQVFSRSDHLATHKRTHSGEKPYKCSMCDYAACRRDMITRHMKTHTLKEETLQFDEHRRIVC